MAQITIDQNKLATYCRKYHISRLSLFGSALHGNLRPDSDVDVLVEFEPGAAPGLLGMACMERELTEMFGRQVDLRTPEDLSRYFRQTVVNEAEVQFPHSVGTRSRMYA